MFYVLALKFKIHTYKQSGHYIRFTNQSTVLCLYTVPLKSAVLKHAVMFLF